LAIFRSQRLHLELLCLKGLRKKFSIQGSRGLYASACTLSPNIQRLSIAAKRHRFDATSQKDLRHTRRTILDPLPVLIEMTQIHALACFFGLFLMVD